MREYRKSQRLRVVLADIATLEVDAIVTAANESLLGGGGVDGAVHDAAGPQLQIACDAIGGCPTGEARITPGFNLPARWVVHAVGPIWRGGDRGEPELLRRCYAAALKLVTEASARTIAIPCISAGAFGFPLRQSCEIAVAAVTEWQDVKSLPHEVTFCCWQPQEFREYKKRLSDALTEM